MPKINPNPNWNKIVTDLLKHQTQEELKAKTGVSQSVISDIKQGKPKKRMSWAYGAALLNAHDELETA